MVTSKYAFSVCTPTFNRAYLLGDLYRSLVDQAFRDFEWIIVDDGSTDNTKQLVDAWFTEGRLPIIYIFQENSGKHVAVNLAVEVAKGELFLVQDSDDVLLPDALERMERMWLGLSPTERSGLDGLMGLCALPGGVVLPKKFPVDVMTMSHLEYWFKYCMKGDKCAVVRTDLLRRYPSPHIEGEKFLVESVAWNRMNPRFLCVNEVFRVIRYLPDGLSADPVGLRRRNPKGACLGYAEASRLPIPLKFRLKNMASFVRYAMHGGGGFKDWRTCWNRGWLLLAVPVGLALAFFDNVRALSALGRNSLRV